ncbi:YihY/virulence factor BrkB family protein [Thermoleophilia bacterium SCSIO 60948]|nr:YihY/virulence factor BrkB family protein [Thermoleophilia bacterium SCSIO 60948]
MGSMARLPRREWWAAVKSSVGEFNEKQLGDRAAALTYYTVLAIFPGLAALVGLFGLLGSPGTVDSALEVVGDLGPQSAVDTLGGPLESIQQNTGAAGVAFILGIAGAIFSASGYVGAFMRAANVVYDASEERSFFKQRPLQFAITLVTLLILVAILLALVVSGPVAESIGSVVGVGDTAVAVWSIVKWPFVLVGISVIFSLLYYAAPDVRHRGFSWLVPGAVLAVVLWIAASALFALYVANFSSYDATYGTLAGVVIFLVWIWITNLVILLGLVLNAQLERRGISPSEAVARGRTELPEAQVLADVSGDRDDSQTAPASERTHADPQRD